MNANYLTIGKNLSDLYQVEEDNGYYEQLGRSFCEFIKDKNPRRVLKKMNFDLLGMEIFFFGLEIEEVKDTKMILIRKDKAQFKVKIINGKLLNSNNEPFYIKDMFQLCHHFIVIDNVESMGINACKNLMNWVLRQINIPILLQAGYLYYGEYETKNSSSNIIKNLIHFYENLGFVNVNNYIGCYNESRVMLKADKEFILNLETYYQ